MNTMLIDGYNAVVKYDPDIEMFRGEFVGLNGGADFYAADVEGLKREGVISLRMFLDECRKKGREPRTSYSGNLSLRIPPELHAAVAADAAAEGVSINRRIIALLSR